MGIIIDKCNSIIVSCIYCCTVAGDYNLQSKIREDYYRGRFQF